MKRDPVRCQYATGLDQIMGAFVPLQLGGIEHDRQIILDTEGATYLGPLLGTKARGLNKPPIVDHVRHPEYLLLRDAKRAIKLVVRAANCKKSRTLAVERLQRRRSERSLELSARQLQMRLASH